MISKFLGYREKMHHVPDQKHSIKCAYWEKGCKIVVRIHIDYPFPVGNKNDILFSTLFILPFETLISIYNDRNCPILDNHENGIIRISLHTSHFIPKGANSCSRLLINFKYNNYIQDKKPVLAERNMDVMGTQ